ncbi:MAG: hypothetical protein E6K49_02060 [Gammaproteobacteria bacterium]|nr:MAG: hypothetical protein E6K49_02060 [Gammaproteobacteria bacterium]
MAEIAGGRELNACARVAFNTTTSVRQTPNRHTRARNGQRLYTPSLVGRLLTRRALFLLSCGSVYICTSRAQSVAMGPCR